MDLKHIVKQLGLSEKEAAVYIACLKCGQSPVSVIAKKAQYNRVTTYDILERLNINGLVSFCVQNEVKHFSPVSPETVLRNFQQRAREFEKALPELRSLQKKQGKKPKVRYFEGVQGLKMVYEDTLTASTEILNYSNSKIIRDYWPEYDQEYVPLRTGKKIFLRGISPFDEYGLKVQAENQKNHRNIRLVSSKEFHFTNEINIYDDKIAICSFQDEPIGIIIQSKEIADTQRDIFKMAWKYAELEEKLLQPKKKINLQDQLNKILDHLPSRRS
jgi:sugar-specific transcriptional regulator TrmB